ncbi:unnamed protein product [Arctogadus glacialis]
MTPPHVLRLGSTPEPEKGSSELDWSSVDLPHWSPQTQIWIIMFLVMWMFGAVTCRTVLTLFHERRT